MKAKLLFLLKLLVISLVLFIFLGWIQKGYQIILLLICSLLLPPDQSAVSLDYANYLRLIPFLALMLATPRITVARRVVVILVGLVIFISIDIVSILAGGASLAHNQQSLILSSARYGKPLVSGYYHSCYGSLTSIKILKSCLCIKRTEPTVMIARGKVFIKFG